MVDRLECRGAPVLRRHPYLNRREAFVFEWNASLVYVLV